MLFTALFVSCSDDEKENSKGNAKAKLILSVDMAPQASMGYIIPVQDENVSEVSFANAMEVKSNPYLYQYKDWVFAVGGATDDYIHKFIRNNDGTLTKTGSLQIDRSAPMAAYMICLSDTKAYASAPLENKIVIFNPSTMERTGEIDLADTAWGVDGSNTPNPMGMYERDGIVYVGLGQFDNMPICKAGAHVLLIDTKTDTPIKRIVDDRLTGASIIGECGMFEDENGDLYVPCWGSYGYVAGQYSGLVRIKKGETDFDKSYCFKFTGVNIEGVEGGQLQYVLTSHYAGNGEIYFFGYCPAFIGSAGPDYINDKTNYSLKGNIYSQAIEVLDLPRTNGYSTAINHKGDKVYFGLVTENNGTGLFIYDRATKTCGTSPAIKVQGSITGIRFYE